MCGRECGRKKGEGTTVRGKGKMKEEGGRREGLGESWTNCCSCCICGRKGLGVACCSMNGDASGCCCCSCSMNGCGAACPCIHPLLVGHTADSDWLK